MGPPKKTILNLTFEQNFSNSKNSTGFTSFIKNSPMPYSNKQKNYQNQTLDNFSSKISSQKNKIEQNSDFIDFLELKKKSYNYKNFRNSCGYFGNILENLAQN